MRRRRIVMALTLAAMTSLVLVPSATAAAPDCSALTDSVYSTLNPTTESQLLTLWPGEVQSARKYGYTRAEGALLRASDTPAAGLVPVWRAYSVSNNDFVWATDGQQLTQAVAEGYSKQKVDFYASPAAASCTTPVFRLAKGPDHRFVTEQTRRDSLLRKGWIDEGTPFHTAAIASVQPAPVPEDTRFSIAVLPDTQQEVLRAGDTRFAQRSQWLADRRQALDLRYVIHVGDIVNWDTADHIQFQRAAIALKPLRGVVPLALAAGNHDTAAVCQGGSACPGADTSLTVRNTTTFNSYLAPVSTPPKGTFEPNKQENAYGTLRAGGVDWLVMTLELWPRPAVVAWAENVVATHPKHNVIIVTHAYLEADASISGSNGGYGATSPRYLFDRLVRAYPNVKVVLSGHVGTSASRTDEGVGGNKIASFLQAFHSDSTNPVRLLDIDTASGTITTTIESPWEGRELSAYRQTIAGMTFVRP